mmetsp:Transcript_12087/g.50883  ORF Transcript_12087/g.50883 Transcript_12087/m.50883 type:complete len:220 (-) Transcript_12087:111-770(-)
MYKKPSSSLCSSYTALMSAAVGGSTLLTKMKMAFSGLSLMRLRMTYLGASGSGRGRHHAGSALPPAPSPSPGARACAAAMRPASRATHTNCPTVRSEGTRYLCLSMSGMSLFSDFSTMTGMRSGYFSRMRCASAWRFCRGCSCLNAISTARPPAPLLPFCPPARLLAPAQKERAPTVRRGARPRLLASLLPPPRRGRVTARGKFACSSAREGKRAEWLG